MRHLIVLALCVALVFPYGPAQANNYSQPTEYEITHKTLSVAQAVLNANRARKVVTFRGNKSARFAEFENLALAPQQARAKQLLRVETEVADAQVVNFAQLPDENVAQAVSKVETKVTQKTSSNPAIAGYGRSRQNVYAALNAKRALDARENEALMAKLDQFKVEPGRMQGKIQRAAQTNMMIVRR